MRLAWVSSVPDSVRAPKLAGQEPAVLIVDDQEANIQLIGTLLTQAGYEVIPAMSAAQAMERLDGQSVALALVDMVMPEVDGIELARKLRQSTATAELPIIMLTAHHDPAEEMMRAFEAGVVDFIAKPFIARELLARIRVHVELKSARDSLARVAAERRDLMALIAHDLKNPFSSIKFACELMEETESAGQLNKLRGSVMSAAEDGLALIHRFLEQQADEDFERGIKLQPVAVQAVLRDLQSAFAVQVEAKALSLKFAIDEGLHAQADPEVLHGVLANLLSNAIKYSPSGSVIDVIASAEAGDRLRVVVRDRGPGISESERKNLFRRYRRLSARPTAGESSTGIGLALAKRDVEQMGGELRFEPCPDRGSMFSVVLPAASTDAAPTPSPS